MSPRATDRLRHIAAPLSGGIPDAGSSLFSEYTSTPHSRAIALVPSVESASTTMTWSTSRLRRFRRVISSRIGPMVSATLRVGRTRLTVAGDRAPAAGGSARPAKSRWWKERASNQSRAPISMTHPLLRPRCFPALRAELMQPVTHAGGGRAGGFRDHGGLAAGEIEKTQRY